MGNIPMKVRSSAKRMDDEIGELISIRIISRLKIKQYASNPDVATTYAFIA